MDAACVCICVCMPVYQRVSVYSRLSLHPSTLVCILVDFSISVSVYKCSTVFLSVLVCMSVSIIVYNQRILVYVSVYQFTSVYTSTLVCVSVYDSVGYSNLMTDGKLSALVGSKAYLHFLYHVLLPV